MNPFSERLKTCRAQLDEKGADLAVVFPSPNLTYLTGFVESPSERHFLCLIPRWGEPTLLAPAMYDDQLTEVPIDDVRLWDDDDDPTALLADVIDGYAQAVETVLVDDRMWATFTLDLQSLLPEASFERAGSVLNGLRVRKDDRELEALRRAGELADDICEEIRARADEFVGETEAALASEIDRLLVEGGGTRPAFTTIVASGSNGARPHHHSGNRRIESGDPVVLDFGAFVAADFDIGTSTYPGDQTRTIVFGGEPSAEYERVHEVVRTAQERAVNAVEPGVSARSIDRVARDTIEEAGYGDAFVHRTGHGVGLEVHEPPYIVGGNDRKLEPGMVFSVEPGIYLPGRFGVRIEDLVIVTAGGCERLNDSPRGWEAGSRRPS